MKKIMIPCIAILVFAGCNDAEDLKLKPVPSDLFIEKLSGNVYLIEETPFQADSTGKIGEADTCCVSIWDYDNNGYVKIFTQRAYGGGVKEENFYERYENGLWKSSKTLKKKLPGGTFETTIDKNGNYITAIEYDSVGNAVHYYNDLTQNENGQVLTWKEFDKDSVFRTEGANTFDTLLLRTSFTLKDSVGNIKSTTSFKYNAKGELIEETKAETAKDSTSPTVTVTKYTYETHDDHGNWTQRTTWNDQGKATKIHQRVYNYNDPPAK